MKLAAVRMAKPALSERREQVGKTLLTGATYHDSTSHAGSQGLLNFAARQEARRLMAQKGGKA